MLTNNKSKILVSRENYEDGVELDNFLEIVRLEKVLWAVRRQIVLVTGITIAVCSVFLLKAFSSPNIYQSKFEILTEPRTAENELTSSIPESLGSQSLDGREKSIIPINDTTIQILQSPKLISSVLKRINKKYPNINYDSLIANLTITPTVKKTSPYEKNTNILEITYQNPDPTIAKLIAELLADSYIKYSLDQTLSNISQGINFVEIQIPQLEQEVEKRENQIKKLQSLYNTNDPDKVLEALSNQIILLEDELGKTQIELKQQQFLYKQIQQEIINQSPLSLSVPAISENEIYQNIRIKIIDIDSQIARQSSIYTDTNIEITNLKEERLKLLTLLQQVVAQIQGEKAEEIKASQINLQEEKAKEIKALEIRRNIIYQNMNILNQRKQLIFNMNQEYKKLNRELTIFTENLNKFLSKKEALRIEASQTVAPWQLLSSINEAQPLPKNLSTFKKEIVLGLVLGLFLGMFFAIIVDTIRDRFYNIEELQDFSGLPILATLPSSNKINKSDNIFDQSIFKAFYSMYSNIQYLDVNMDIHSLVITSSISKEEKSTIIKCLGQVIAQTDRKILIVNTNFDVFSDDKSFQEIKDDGLTDILAKNVDLEKVITQFGNNNNLWYLDIRSLIDSNRMQLLTSEKMSNLMKELELKFDLIIYDTSPLLKFSYAYPIIKNSQAVILVNYFNKTKRIQLEESLRNLKSIPTKILGIIVST